MIYYHNINPVLVNIFGFDIYYYSFAYILGLIAIPYFVNKKYLKDKTLADKLTTYIGIATILGGRIGYILFYNFKEYIENPISMLNLREGGMSFHGGMIGFIVGIVLFSRKYKKNTLEILDLTVIIVPICLFFGRIMNFVNGELYGRPTDGSWGVIFPYDYLQIPRHPSQLYESFFEGLVLFGLILLVHKFYKSKYGITASVFLILYGIFRFGIEFFREPDANIGYIFQYFTLGQILCTFMVLCGVTGMICQKIYPSSSLASKN